MGNMFGGGGSTIKDPHAFVAEQLALGRLVVFSKSYCPSRSYHFSVALYEAAKLTRRAS